MRKKEEKVNRKEGKEILLRKKELGVQEKERQRNFHNFTNLEKKEGVTTKKTLVQGKFAMTIGNLRTTPLRKVTQEEKVIKKKKEFGSATKDLCFSDQKEGFMVKNNVKGGQNNCFGGN